MSLLTELNRVTFVFSAKAMVYQLDLAYAYNLYHMLLSEHLICLVKNCDYSCDMELKHRSYIP